MEAHCIPFSEIPHTSTLFADYLYHFPRVSRFYAYDPFQDGSFSAAAHRVSIEEARRTAVADVLAEQNELFGASSRTQENIVRLRSGQAYAVVTGQQAGLFGGPAYAAYKALTAIEMAQSLTGRGIAAVPVFWMASEDHDFQEVNHAAFLDERGQLLELRDPSGPPPDTPIGLVHFDSSIGRLRAQLDRLWPRELTGEPQRLLEGYAAGTGYGEAFARLFHQLFAGSGLIILDPLHPTFHALSRPLYRRVLAEADSLQKMVETRNRQLEQAGYHVQVRLRENATLAFLTANGHRLPIRRRKDAFYLPGLGEQSRASLLEQLENEPSRFSANVLLRPVVQDSLLPTVAYVAGPNEVAYFAQASVLYEKLIGRMPVIVPRVSLTLVDRKAQRLLRRYEVDLSDCFRGRAHLGTQLALRRLPVRLLKRLETTEAKLEKLLAETAQAVGKLDPTLEGAIETSRRKMLYQFNKIRHKAARAQAEREAVVARHVEILTNSLFPGRTLQERRLSFLSFVARYGRDLVPRLLEQVNFPCRDHQVIFL